MALMVKSRRERSSRIVGAKATLSGRRPSLYPVSVRKVVTSKVVPLKRTVTVPCLMPVGMTRRKSGMTWSGSASVAMSKSVWDLPMKDVADGAAHQVALEAGLAKRSRKISDDPGDAHCGSSK